MTKRHLQISLVVAAYLAFACSVLQAQQLHPLAVVNGEVWDISVYDRDYFDFKDESEARENAAHLLGLNLDDIISVNFMRGPEAVSTLLWGPRAKYGLIEVSIDNSKHKPLTEVDSTLLTTLLNQAFVKQAEKARKSKPAAKIKVSGTTPCEGDVVKIKVRDKNGPLNAVVSLPGNMNHLFRRVGLTDDKGRIAFNLQDVHDCIRVTCPGYYDVEVPISGTRMVFTLEKNPLIDEYDISLSRQRKWY